MSETKHTPGPWRVDATVALGPMGIYSETAEQELSGVCWFTYARKRINGKEMSREEVESNARLIAAAPEMLAACERSLALLQDRLNLADILDSEKSHIDSLKNTIAKAKGA